MLLNLTNHPGSRWSSRQMNAALDAWESVVDYPFPDVFPEAEEKDIIRQARAIADDAESLHPDAVLCQGEMSMVFVLVQLFQEKGIPVYAATSRRISEESVNADGSVEKESVFQFVRFRRWHGVCWADTMPTASDVDFRCLTITERINYYCSYK